MSTSKHPALIAWEIYRKAAAEGRTVSVSWEDGKGIKSFIGRQPKRLQGRCGALCRTGEPCKMRVAKGRRRCRLHGGLSTGPKTAEGRARISEANRRRADSRKRNREELIERGKLVVAEMERREKLGLPPNL